MVTITDTSVVSTPSMSTAHADMEHPPEDFQGQYDALLDAYFATEAQVDDALTNATVAAGPVSRVQRMLELQSQMGHLCAVHGELRRGLDHFETLHSLVETEERKLVPAVQVSEEMAQESSQEELRPEGDVPEEQAETVAKELRAVLVELKINAETNLATIQSRLGDAKAAMGHVFTAKKAMRGLQEMPESPDRAAAIKKLEVVLTANYSALLQRQGATDDALAAAETVLDLAGPVPKKKAKAPASSDPAVDAARLTAIGVLTWCARSKGDNHKTHELSLQGAQAVKLGHASQDALLLARTHANIGLDCYESRDLNGALVHFLAAYRVCVLTASDPLLQAKAVLHVGRCLANFGTTAILEGGGYNPPREMSANDCFALVQEEAENDLFVGHRLLKVLAQACLGEQAFYDGNCVMAASHFSAALATLGGVSDVEISKTERVKIQGYVESYLGSALFAEGKLEAAEAAHQRDLELALDTEDLYAQMRALRNVALLYNFTQRFVEGITLWRETLEIASVLDSKHDLLVGYAGLGAALKALTIADFNRNEFHDFLAASENELRPIFLKQRALAIELGDVLQQFLAQRQIVSTYEWQPQTEELEQRLEECDSLVRLSEQLGDVQYRADGYRALANAITVQIARLAERGQRFADAIRVLKFKRNLFLQKLRDTTKVPAQAPRPLRVGQARIEVL